MTHSDFEADVSEFPLLTAIRVSDGGELLFGPELDSIYRCPNCNNETTLERYDVLGADDGCVICAKCSEELRLH